jgi:hypothetical protein
MMGKVGGMTQPGLDTPTVDTAEMVHISSLALLKMLKHGNLKFTQEEPVFLWKLWGLCLENLWMNIQYE